jgi:hypothetical protein
MRKLLVLALVLGMVGVAAAYDLGNQAPVKSPGTYPENIPNPILQGGDTVANAVVITALPYTDSGTTTGYVDNYTGPCFYAGGAPDVVYSYTPAATVLATISLCGSSYDTGLNVVNSAMVSVACNDDFCGVQSQVEVSLTAGTTYYIIVDGYASGSGTYTLNVTGAVPCIFECVNGVDEGEPDLYDEYLDLQNGGCNSPNLMFQHLAGDQDGNLLLCANSGWYFYTGLNYRDTDWFSVLIGASGSVEMEYFGEQALFMFDLTTGLTCPAGGVAGPTSTACPVTYTLTGAPGSLKTFVMLPPAWTPTTQTWHYRLALSGLVPEIIATEATTWGTLKALYQ